MNSCYDVGIHYCLENYVCIFTKFQVWFTWRINFKGTMRKEKKIRPQPGWIEGNYLCHMIKSWCIVKFSTCFRSQILHVVLLVWDNLVKIKIINKEYKSTLLISCDWEHKLSIERPYVRWPICVFFLTEDYFFSLSPLFICCISLSSVKASWVPSSKLEYLFFFFPCSAQVLAAMLLRLYGYSFLYF